MAGCTFGELKSRRRTTECCVLQLESSVYLKNKLRVTVAVMLVRVEQRQARNIWHEVQHSVSWELPYLEDAAVKTWDLRHHMILLRPPVCPNIRCYVSDS